MNGPIVMKFGGDSMQDATALRRVAGVIGSERRRRVVVVSALGGVLDALSALAEGGATQISARETTERLRDHHVAIVRELVDPLEQDALAARVASRYGEAAHLAVLPARYRTASTRDALLATGELAGSEVVAAVLSAAGVPAFWLDARDVIVTDDAFGRARPDPARIHQAARRRLAPLLETNRVPVLAGFIGATPGGATTTLGRGGSNQSAAVVGAAVGAQDVQIWADVGGVLTMRPALVEGVG